MSQKYDDYEPFVPRYDTRHIEYAIQKFAHNLTLPYLLIGNTLVVSMVEVASDQVRDILKANNSTLTFILEAEENVEVYLDFGFNRERLTKQLLHEFCFDSDA